MLNGFARDLTLWGPHSAYRPCDLEKARAYWRRLAHTHYENFSNREHPLPRRLLRHFHAIYAYCRLADDLGDETGGGARALGLLQWWRQELARCYDGKAHHPVMMRLEAPILRFQIPPEPFLELIRAFEQDQHIKRYLTYTQILE